MDKEFVLTIATMSSAYRKKQTTIEDINDHINEGTTSGSEHTPITRNESEVSISSMS